jgi:hypothetical protein
MGIKFTTPQEAIDDLMNVIPAIIESEIIRAFSYLGEQCIKRIRDRGPKESWFDQTGNLRSSIGYAVYDYGKKVIESTFEVVKNGSQGASVGRKVIDDLASKYAETYALVVVAGMDYAEAVEARDNKDVLASTELWAKQEIQKYLNKALERAYGKILILQHELGL